MHNAIISSPLACSFPPSYSDLKPSPLNGGRKFPIHHFALEKTFKGKLLKDSFEDALKPFDHLLVLRSSQWGGVEE